MSSSQPLIKQLQMCARWSPGRMMHLLRQHRMRNHACYHSNSVDCVGYASCLHIRADRQGQCTGTVHRIHFKWRRLLDTMRCTNTCNRRPYSGTNLQTIFPFCGNMKRHLCTITICFQWQPCSVALDKRAAFHSNASSAMSVDRPSALFISDAVAQHTGSIPVTLDLEDVLVNRFSDLEASVKLRGWNTKLDMPLHELVDDYKTMKTMQAERTLLQKKRTEIVDDIQAIDEQNYDDQIATAMKEKLIIEGRSLREQHKQVTHDLWPIERRVMLSVLSLPNFLLPNVPEHTPVVLAERAASDEHVQCSHTDSAYKDIIYFSPVGMRAYYLCGEAAILEQELTAHVCDCLQKSGLIRISGSDYFRSVITEGCGNDFTDPHEVFTLASAEPKAHEQIENAYHLSGAGLESFAAYLAWSKIKTESLPLMLFTTGRCYSATQLPIDDGLFSAMQSSNVEVFGAASSLEQSLSLAQDIEDLFWEIHTSLELPIRLVDIPSHNLHRREMRRVEVQAKTATPQQFVTVATVSIIGDYVSQRLAMKHSAYVKRSPDLSNLYIVHGCAANITRLVACCVENGMYNQETGRFVLPSSIPRSLSNIESTS